MAMKIFIGQRVTGEDINSLVKESEKVLAVLKEAGHEAKHFIDEEGKLGAKIQLNHAFEEIDKRDVFLAIIRSNEKSEGMLIEVDYALAKGKKLIVAVKKGVDKTYVPELADHVIKFSDVHDICNKLKELI